MARVCLAAACASASLLVVAGCGGDAAESSGIPRQLAERLATASEAVAERLESGDPCDGLRLATRLESTARTAIANERIPPALAGELLASIQDLERSVDCPPATPAAAPPPPTQTVTVEAQTDEDEHKDKPRNDHEDKGHGKNDERGEDE
jgi:hypothetical protein